MNNNALRKEIELQIKLCGFCKNDDNKAESELLNSIMLLFQRREEELIEQIEVMGVLSESHLLVEGSDWREFKEELFKERKSE